MHIMKSLKRNLFLLKIWIAYIDYSVESNNKDLTFEVGEYVGVSKCKNNFEKRLLPSKHLLVFKASWRRLQDMSWRRFQYVFSVTILCLPRRLEDVLQRCHEDVLKTSWRHLARHLQDVLENEKLLRWWRLENMSWRLLEDMSWWCLQSDLESSKMFTGVICT